METNEFDKQGQAYRTCTHTDINSMDVKVHLYLYHSIGLVFYLICVYRKLGYREFHLISREFTYATSHLIRRRCTYT